MCIDALLLVRLKKRGSQEGFEGLGQRWAKKKNFTNFRKKKKLWIGKTLKSIYLS